MHVKVPLNGPVRLSRITANRTATGDSPTADSGLTLVITSPADVVTTIANGSLQNIATGLYIYFHKPTAVGLWRYVWTSSTYGNTEDTAECVSVIADT